MPRVSTAASVSAALCVASAMGACSLFVDTDGLSVSAVDAAVASDGSFDAPIAQDSAIASDAGSDADSEAAAPPFCASHPGHVLCYDFDESAVLPPFDNSDFDPGHLLIDSTQSVSPPHSLLAVYDPGTSNEQFQRSLTSTTRKLSWALDMRVSSSNLSTGQTTPIAVDVPAVEALSDHFFFLQTYFDMLAVSEAATPADGGPTTYTSTLLVAPVALDAWLHVEFTVDGSTGVITSSLNGTALPNAQSQYGFPNGTMLVTIGGYGGNVPATTDLNIDNVLVDF